MATQQIAIPDHLKKFLSSPAASTDTDAMASASVSIPRISLKGRKFRLIEGGEEIRKPADELFAVILAVEPGPGLMAKTFYKGVYQSGDSSPPDCSSSNGITPDPWISDPQSDKCQKCPMNVFGSAKSRSGGKAKACKDSKRLWLVEPNAINGTVYNMGVPVTSLKDMSAYGAMLKANGVPSASVITKLSMKDTEFPELVFEFVGVLEETAMVQAMERNEKKDWDLKYTGPMLEGPVSSGPIAAPGQPVEGAALLGSEGEQSTEKLSADEAAKNW
jgi:hypothetical protein